MFILISCINCDTEARAERNIHPGQQVRPGIEIAFDGWVSIAPFYVPDFRNEHICPACVEQLPLKMRERLKVMSPPLLRDRRGY